MRLADRIMVEHPASELARALPGAGRFVLDRHVVEAIDRFHGPPLAFHEALPHARLPYPETWLEMDARADSGRLLRIGYLARAREEGFTVETASAADHAQIVPGAAWVRGDGLRYRPDCRLDEHDIHAVAAGHVLRFLLLLNSRSRVLEVSEVEDLERLNRARRKRGRPELLPVSAVRLDLSRPIAHARRRGASDDAASVRAHLVRGHFKLRKSGVFWWSPHRRGGGQPAPAAYHVTTRRDP